ncbi:MAG TPA: deoxyribodipyrimidine photo-lyase [Solirubrobacteraceae bacterium]|nr:deoxyribodipyrimidine photo-lyase [Solirubrobacteraceae bacterium]
MAAESSRATTALLWLRRDLRLHDHPALGAALREHERVVPVFVLDEQLLRGRFASGPRTEFMLGCLRALDAELRRRGSALVVRRGSPERELAAVADETGATAVFWTSDVSPYARTRDRRVSDALRERGVAARPHGGNYVADVSLPRTGAGEPFRVFSPFFRAWRELPRREVLPAPAVLPALPAGIDAGSLPESAAALGVAGARQLAAPITAPGETAARTAMGHWIDRALADYAERQDGMARRGSSQLSPYLRWGCLSARELEAAAGERGGAGAAAWIRQLAWREFYAHVLLMWPENLWQEFQPRFRSLEWDDAPEHLESWQHGLTGYPAVDAGMRQLAQTGWMHNRARLIVGAFLTKDLHLDWRTGERWFEALLLDGEPAQNNGNWQWIASVGVDPAPPFRRMYNPTLQGRRFDPSGEYVRRWIPELARVPDEHLWEPWRMAATAQRTSGCRIGHDYPAPIVDHSLERRRALERYGAARGQGG